MSAQNFSGHRFIWEVESNGPPKWPALGREYVRQGFTPPVRSWELAIAHFNALSGTRVRHERRIARDALAIELPEHRVEVSPVAVRVEPHRWVELHADESRARPSRPY